MKCCDITASKLNRQIVLLRRTEATDGMGGNTEAWTPLAYLWAMVKPVSGRERAYRGGVEAQVDYRMVIRFTGDGEGYPSYTADDRVEYQGKTYGIDYVLDVEDARTWLELGVRAAK